MQVSSSNLTRLARRPLVAAVFSAMAALAVFWPATQHDFVYDDRVIALEDERLNDPGYIFEVWVRPWWPDGSAVQISRPLTSASFWLQVQMSPEVPTAAAGGDGADAPEHPARQRIPFWFHLVNVILFAITSALVALLAWRWTRRWWAAWAAGLLFAVHPIHVEVAANVVGRAEIMSAMFVTLGLYLYLGWRDRLTIGRSLVLAGVILLGGLSKEHGYLLAPMMGLAEVALRRVERRAIFGKPWHVPLVIMVAVVAGLAIAQRHIVSDQVETQGVVSELDNPMPYAEPGERVVTPLKLLGRVTELFLFPVDQSPDYSPSVLMPTTDMSDPRVLVGLVTLLAWVGACVYAWRSRKRVLGVLLCLPVTWIIPSNTVILIGTIFGERLLMLMSVFVPIALVGLIPVRKLKTKHVNVGLAVGLAVSAFYVWMTAQMWAPLAESGYFKTHLDLPAAIGLVAVIVLGVAAWSGWTRRWRVPVLVGALALAFGYAAQSYARTWQSPDSHIQSTVIRQDRSGRFQAFYADHLVRQLAATEEVNQIKSGELTPDEVFFSAPADSWPRQLFETASTHAMLALELWPRQARPYGALAYLNYVAGNEQEARKYAQFARRGSDETMAEFVFELLGERESEAELEERIEVLERRLTEDPDDREALIAIGWAYRHLFKFTKAREYFDRAIDIDTETDPELLTVYLDVLDRSGGIEEASQLYQNWLAREPDNPVVLLDASIWHSYREMELDAVDGWLTRLEKIAGGDPKVIFARGIWLERTGKRDAALAAYDRAIAASPKTDPRRAHYILQRDELRSKR